MINEIIGRDVELAQIDAFLDRPTDGHRALVLEGQAGIGKSTLWLAGVERARDRPFHVLTSRPAETERTLAHVVLGDLFADIAPEAVAGLPAPRRRAFEAALLLRDELDVAVDPRALGVAIVTLLPILAQGRPLLLAIDDDQWMDPSSVETLRFALRRSIRQPVLLLVSRRVDGRPAAVLENAIDPAEVERVQVGPLSVGAMQALLRQHLDLTLPRPALLHLHEVSGGNPFYALELSRARVANPGRDPTVPLAVPGDLQEVVRARLDGLDSPTRKALLLVAAHGRMPIGLLPALAITTQAVEQAHEAKVVETEGGVIRFSHPLLASAVYHGAASIERRAAHRILAAAIDDPVLRGRHIALGAEGPDHELATALESAANAARARGIPIAAAELAEQAWRLTPLDAADDRHRRGIATARAQFEAGDGSRARAIASDVRTGASAGQAHAEALILSAELENSRVALAYLDEALVEARAVPELRAIVHARFADWARGTTDHALAERHAEASLRLAEHLDDDSLRATALGTLAALRFDRGDPQALELAQRALALALRGGDPREVKWAGASVSLLLAWSGETGRARPWLEAQLIEWRDRDEDARLGLLTSLALVELWSGRWTTASGHADQAKEISDEYGLAFWGDHFVPALIALHRGQFAVAREHSRLGIARLHGQLVPAFPAVLGICEMWTGNPVASLPHFIEAEEMSDGRSLDEANNRWWRAEYVEALLQAGRLDDAESLIDQWDGALASISRDRVVAQLTRCRGLVAASRGDLSAAAELLELAVERHQAVDDPFGRSRALLALGVVSRRARQKRSARVSLEEALAGFEGLGAMSWVSAARTEVARIGGRQRIEGLSPSELQVAELVAAGRTNREVASALFLSATTVASHLSTVYSKLGVRSRTELARQLPPPPASVPASKVPPS